MDSLAQQLYAFSVIILAGISFGFLFDFYRVIRGILRPGVYFTHLLDLVFWLAVAPILTTYILLANWGELRFYLVIGLLLGLGFYVLLLSRAVIGFFLWLINFVGKLINLVFSIVLFFVGFPIKILQDLILALQSKSRFSFRRRKVFWRGLRWKGGFLSFLRR